MTKEKSIAQFLNVQKFPFFIKDEKGNELYYENDEGYWSRGEFDSNNKITYFENSEGYWSKSEYDASGKEVYYEDTDGIDFDIRPKVEITLEEIAALKGVSVSQIRVKE